jgi:cellulose biosynthesis protein BcsQ
MLSNMIVVGADKGGAGKSTLTANLGGQMAAAGWKTLVIELDYQGDLGSHLGYESTGSEGRSLMDAMFEGGDLDIQRNVRGRENLDFLPAGRWTRILTQALIAEDPLHDLETVLARVAPHYNAILCDTRPEVDNQLLLQALAAARFVLIPFRKDRNDKASVARFKAVVDRMHRDQINPDLEILGSVLFLWRRGKRGLDQYLDDREAETGVRPLRSVICEASDALEDITSRGLLTYEYALEIERILQSGGHAKVVSDRGYSLSVAGTRVTRGQREGGRIPADAVVVGNVRLGGGLAADYHSLGEEVMSALVERLSVASSQDSAGPDPTGGPGPADSGHDSHDDAELQPRWQVLAGEDPEDGA